MVKIPIEDIFSYNDPESITIQRTKEGINFNNSNLKSIKIPNHFKKQVLSLHPDKNIYSKQIKKSSNYVQNIANQYGYSNSIYTAIYEGLLNAHQHGNNYNENKQIILASHINEKKLEIIIADQGDKLPKMFLPFILQLRGGKKGEFLDWYKYSGETKNRTNLGTGTSFMHSYMDEIRYYISKDTKGLAIYMNKKK